MKLMKLAVVLLALSVVAFAQHGAGSGGHMGGSPGMGNGNGTGGTMGSGHGMGSPGVGDRGMGDMRGSQMGRQAPSDVLSHNTKLASNLERILPNGMTAQQACNGFKNLGQCVAAAHVSHNLSIPFDQLKLKMTGSGSASLGKAIEDLKPGVDAKREAKKAQKQAHEDLNES